MVVILNEVFFGDDEYGYFSIIFVGYKYLFGFKFWLNKDFGVNFM